MTRQIKFRIPMFTDKGHFTEFQYLKLGDDIEGTLCGYNGEPQQFTGLLDKNGKEIYEGDVVRLNEDVFEIRYFAPHFALFNKNVEEDSMYDGPIYEIIGNLYENPELLTK